MKPERRKNYFQQEQPNRHLEIMFALASKYATELFDIISFVSPSFQKFPAERSRKTISQNEKPASAISHATCQLRRLYSSGSFFCET
jgi:hypothetical protein